jgi:hypothetical protein
MGCSPYLTVSFFHPQPLSFKTRFDRSSIDLASTNCSRLDHLFEQPRPYRIHFIGSITDHDTQNMSEKAIQNFEDDRNGTYDGDCEVNGLCYRFASRLVGEKCFCEYFAPSQPSSKANPFHEGGIYLLCHLLAGRYTHFPALSHGQLR